MKLYVCLITSVHSRVCNHCIPCDLLSCRKQLSLSPSRHLLALPSFSTGQWMPHTSPCMHQSHSWAPVREACEWRSEC